MVCRQSRWSACTLTGKPLLGHVVADYLGSLYLYEAVLEFLLARAGLSVDDESQVNHCLPMNCWTSMACSLEPKELLVMVVDRLLRHAFVFGGHGLCAVCCRCIKVSAGSDSGSACRACF